MRFLIDIGHPAHVHYYRNLRSELANRGHSVIVTVRDIPAAVDLLQRYSIPFVSTGSKSDGLIGKGIKQLGYDWTLRKLARQHKIDIGVGTSLTLTHLSALSPVKSVLLDDDDDEVQPLFTKFGHPFASTLLSPESLRHHRKRKDTVFYSGYHELLYLHPNRFVPDDSVLQSLNIRDGQPFFVMRFNAFQAHHDTGANGMNLQQKLELVELLSGHGRVFITTERAVERELEEYRLPLDPAKIHHLLYYATMFLGDSQTMTSEAAVLGTPALRCNSFVGRIAYLEEEEHRYGLTFGFRQEEFGRMLAKVKELLSIPDLKAEWQRRRMRMLAEKIDVTAFLVWFVENYPESLITMKQNPGFQYSFR